MGGSKWAAAVGGVLCCVVAAGVPLNLENMYCWQELGYCVYFPAGWSAAKLNEYTLLLSGKPGTEAYYTTVTIASFASTSAGGQYESVSDLLNAYKCDLVLGSATVCIDSSDYPSGDGYVAEFVHDGEMFRQWRVVVARPDGKVFHAWAFTAPVDLYGIYRPLAEAMYGAWRVDGAARTGGLENTTMGGEISVLFTTRSRINRLPTCNSDSDLSLGRCHMLTYTVNIPAQGYVSLSLVTQRGQWLRATLYDPSGNRVAFRPGNVNDVYTGVHAVVPGVYTIRVTPELFTAESEFELTLYFSTREFSVEDLVSLYGPRSRYLQR